MEEVERLTEHEHQALELVLKDHPELRVLWERRDLIVDPTSINGVDPLLHVWLEAVVEQQVHDEQPVEAKLAIDRLQARGLTRHAARTVIVTLFASYLEEAAEKSTSFDREGYAKALDLLGKIEKKVGRNAPCPCGNGKKFKRCCIDRVGKVSPLLKLLDSPAGVIEKLILGAGKYATWDYLESAAPDDPVLVLENRAQVAYLMEENDDLEGAWLVLKENIDFAAKQEERGYLLNAYSDALTLCENHRELADKGVALIADYIAICEDKDLKLQLRCDKADLLASLGKLNEAQAEYDSLLREHPEWYFGRYRYALFLELQDKKQDALQILMELKALEDKLDSFTLEAVRAALRDKE